ncbi:MAG: hypothetical protein HZA03_00930 [Nitrospinae bacterium]|nr:hypothetical protein [Nitrospinota bacterium]
MDIGQNPVLLLRAADGSLGAAISSNGSANGYTHTVSGLLNSALERFSRGGFSAASLEAVLLGGADNSRWKWDRMLAIARKASLNLKRHDEGGLYYREVHFDPKAGHAAVFRKKANPHDWNPASARLSLESGTKGFSEGHAGGVVANATRFFREKTTFTALREVVIPRHLAETPDEPFLFWSAACSGGAEAYSYAMYIHRTLARLKAACPFKVFATDINQKLVEGAKIGEYKAGKNDLRDYRAYFQRYGALDGDTMRFGKEIQRFISFNTFDLKRKPRKKGFRMVVCANVFQYYDDEARTHFLENFISAAARPGYIFVGPVKEHIVRTLGLGKLAKYKMLLVE